MKPFQNQMLIVSILVFCILTGLDMSPVYAEFTFGPVTNLGPVINTPRHEAGNMISLDSLSICFTRYKLNWSDDQVWVAGRAARHDPWSDPEFLGSWSDYGALSKDILDRTGGILGLGTSDGLEMYDWNDFPGGYGGTDIWGWSRETVESDFGPPVNLGPTVNSSFNEYTGIVSPDGFALYFVSGQSGGYGSADLWVTTRATRSDPWNAPTNLGPQVNSPKAELNPHLSSDGLILLFESWRAGGLGRSDMWMTRRRDLSAPWGQAVNLGPRVNSSANDEHPFISPDGSILYFASTRSGGYGGVDLWQVPIIPIVDFNSDGKVDSADICILIDHWQTDYPACDIAPAPFGDGIVDVRDLIVLSEHLFEEFPPAEPLN
jgi:hypothetical protein